MAKRCLSSLLALALIIMLSFTNTLSAHEIRPAIADVTVSAEQVDIEIRLTLESLVAGLDLSELEDTNDSPLAEKYDVLRAYKPETLASALQELWPEIRKGIFVNVGDQVFPLEINGIDVPEVGDVELSRESTLRMSTALPPGDGAVTIGWQAGYGALVVRQVLESGDGYSGYLTGGELSTPLPRSGNARVPWLTAFTDYIGIGFVHIVPKGLDHILFVLGLFFFSMKLRPLLYQITAFTAAHTVALALAILGYVQVPAGIVEPLIAASIVYVAVENTIVRELKSWRTAVVFGFGLLHGLGFAVVLNNIGLDPGRFATGLIGFNIGVELGQLAVISAAYLAVGYWFGRKPWYRNVIAIPASIAIAIVGAYWFVERVFL